MTEVMKPTEKTKVLIIGSGPAGLTAALYLARANLSPIVLEGDGFLNTMPGGQLMITTEIENFPGMVSWDDNGVFRGHSGPEMMDIMRRQCVHFGARCMNERVVAVDFAKSPFRVESDEKAWEADAVILAVGASARWLNIPSENEYRNMGISACATCDGALFKGKHVVVVGGGDTAMEEAGYLTNHAARVTIVHRREGFRASPVMLEKARNNPKIDWKLNAVITEVYGKQEGFRKFVTGVKLSNPKTGEEEDFSCDGVFVAIGHTPNTSLFKELIKLDAAGYIETEGKTTKTSVKGIFACGDCQDPRYRQAITSAGSGCAAAIDVQHFLDGID
ncbi:MAG: thioredoxin-disulfide reductase [Candidatus Sumerlaeales bacterium]|nr:thioredoxin-disulfide reductase [Candidatus Sumerlaeales bacterium]